MTHFVSGSLYVDCYYPTENVGEYTFENALFNNQNDVGNGAYAIIPGFVIFATPANITTGLPILGVSQRYVLTSVAVIDSARVSGTILWDEKGEEIHTPAPGMFAILTQTTENHKLAMPLIDSNYTEVPPGMTQSVLLNDLVNIIDCLTISNGNSTSDPLAHYILSKA